MNKNLDTNIEFHHIGLATPSINEALKFYLNMGYESSDITLDPIQNVKICFVTKDQSPSIELIEPAVSDSPISKILQKNKGAGTVYHMCYKTKNLDQSILALRKQDFIPLQKPVEAEAMNKARICFLFSKSNGLIELVEMKF